MQILKMTLQVAHESKFLESCNVIIYCVERAAYTWQSAVEIELCCKWRPASWGCFKSFLLCCLHRPSVWGVGFPFPCSRALSLCCCASADGRPGSSQTFRGLFEERANDSFFKCLSMYVCPELSVPPVKAFPLAVQPYWEVSRYPRL